MRQIYNEDELKTLLQKAIGHEIKNLKFNVFVDPDKNMRHRVEVEVELDMPVKPIDFSCRDGQIGGK